MRPGALLPNCGLKMKVLIVDDSAAMRRCIKDLLPPADEKFECQDGEEAVRAFATHRPDWVLMDIEMKPVDGLSAARQIRAACPEARIIFVTSHDRPRFREAVAQLKDCGFVLKDNLEQINQIVAAASAKGRTSL
jgi:two-component system response regulator DesR